MSIITLDSKSKSPNLEIFNNFNVKRKQNKEGYYEGIRLTEGKRYGKWYLEIQVNQVSPQYSIIGICNSQQKMSDDLYYATGFKNIKGIYNTGEIMLNGSDTKFDAKYTTGDIVSVLLDLDSKTLEFWINGKTHGITSKNIEDDLWFPCIFMCNANGEFTINLGRKKFNYHMPKGYKSYDKKQKYIITQNNNYFSIKKSFYKINDSSDKIKIYNENGIEDLNKLIEIKDSKTIQLNLKNEIYVTNEAISFKEITDSINFINEDNEDKKEITYKTSNYKLIDLIKHELGNNFEIGRMLEN